MIRLFTFSLNVLWGYGRYYGKLAKLACGYILWALAVGLGWSGDIVARIVSDYLYEKKLKNIQKN